MRNDFMITTRDALYRLQRAQDLHAAQRGARAERRLIVA